MRENRYMLRAAELAEAAGRAGEVPVGAVVVRDGKIIGEGANTRESDSDVSGHAEINALRAAAAFAGTWKLPDCEIYVTLEPCPMCAAAIAAARIKTVYFGAYDARAGAVESMMRLYDNPLEHRPDFYGGVMEEKNTELIRSFFEERRKNGKNGRAK